MTIAKHRPAALLCALAVAMAAGAAASPARAAGAAIVEEISGKVGNLAEFDYLQPGQVIAIPAGAKITIGYLKSCLQETATGGTLTIGEERSTIAGGRIASEQLACGKGMTLTSAQAGKSGAMVFRAPPGGGRATAKLPEPKVTVTSISPAIALAAPGAVRIERIDVTDPVLSFTAPGRLLDLSKLGARLAPAGLYRVTAGGAETVFRVALDATDMAGPLLPRLVPM